MGQVRRKIFIQHTILATLPSTYQNLLKLVEIWQSSDRNKDAVFFRHDGYGIWSNTTVHCTVYLYHSSLLSGCMQLAAATVVAKLLLYSTTYFVWTWCRLCARKVSGLMIFYRATHMRSVDYATARCLSVRLSIRLSVTRQYSVEMAKHIIKGFHHRVARPF